MVTKVDSRSGVGREIRSLGLTAQLVKNPPAMQETLVPFLGQEDLLEERDRLPTPVFLPGECPWRGGAWQAIVGGVTKSWTQLSD